MTPQNELQGFLRTHKPTYALTNSSRSQAALKSSGKKQRCQHNFTLTYRSPLYRWENRLGAETGDRNSCSQPPLSYCSQPQDGKSLKGECGRNPGQGGKEPASSRLNPPGSVFSLSHRAQPRQGNTSSHSPRAPAMSVAHKDSDQKPQMSLGPLNQTPQRGSGFPEL